MHYKYFSFFQFSFAIDFQCNYIVVREYTLRDFNPQKFVKTSFVAPKFALNCRVQIWMYVSEVEFDNPVTEIISTPTNSVSSISC